MSEYPHIDIHTHAPRTGTVAIAAYMLGEGAHVPDPPCSAGVHPWSLAHLSDADAADALDFLRRADNLSAIGEIGLDYARETDRERQQRIFSDQLVIASERGLPVIVHCVRALDDALRILRGQPLRAVIFHGFTGSPQQARRITDAGYYVSFGARAFGSPKTLEALRNVPRERIFLETDDAPVTIGTIYADAAGTLGIPEFELRRIINDNYKAIFG